MTSSSAKMIQFTVTWRLVYKEMPMPALIDIPTIVNALVTFFAMGGADAAIEVVKGSVAAAAINGGTITITNTRNDD
jgi:hypothetical protein